MKAKDVVLMPQEINLLKMLGENQGYYDCPKDGSGKRTGKLVGYAGKYETAPGSGEFKHYVGERYWNFPRGAERNPEVLEQFVKDVFYDSCYDESMSGEINCAFGCPEGGILPAYEIAKRFECYFSRADKKVIEVATPERREKSELVFGRHTVEPGWGVAIVEDVVNNLSTTDKAIKLIESRGATVQAIICMINRSPEGLTVWEYEGREIPIIAAVLIPTLEYRQDDPYVAADVEAGNVVWKPKDNWNELIVA